jgi:hypothetical protein
MIVPASMGIHRKSSDPHPLPVLSDSTNDQEKMLPLALIRQHAKVDDVMTVSDELLSLYRDASLRAAEKYTGRLFREQRVIHQDVSTKRNLADGDRWKRFYKVTLEEPIADGVLYLYGSKHTPGVKTITVPPGSRTVEIPYEHYAIDMSSCCGDPCGNPGNTGRMLMYRAGLTRCEDISPNIVMGCLKYITWIINNPGDKAGQRNLASNNPETSGNNTAWSSGAIEEWRLVLDDAY